MQIKEPYSIENIVFIIQKKGRITFSSDELKNQYPEKTVRAIELALNRLIFQKKIIPVLKGFYVIIPPEYATWAMVPPVMYLDALMTYLNPPTQNEYLQNMELKIQNEEFLGDTHLLLRPDERYHPVEAWELVKNQLIMKLT